MPAFGHQWGREHWPDADDFLDPLEGEDDCGLDCADEDTIPVGRDPLEILIAIEERACA